MQPKCSISEFLVFFSNFQQIYDGESDKAPFLKRISGDRRKQVIFLTTTTNVALVRFTSDGSIAKSGFTAKFTAGSEAGAINT